MNLALQLNHDPAFRPWAVIPAKAFARAKSRLDGTLAPQQRRKLAQRLLERVLHACTHSRALAGIIVATDGDDVARIARHAGAHVVRDRPEPAAASGSLGAIVDHALAVSRTLGATHALVVMADLPLLQPRDVAELVHPLRDAQLVIAPDAQRRGTNALGLRLDLGLRTCFGHPDSLTRHTHQAQRAGTQLRVYANPRVALDIDTRADLLLHDPLLFAR